MRVGSPTPTTFIKVIMSYIIINYIIEHEGNQINYSLRELIIDEFVTCEPSTPYQRRLVQMIRCFFFLSKVSSLSLINKENL